MKQIIFLFLALPLFASGQNYLFEITPTDGQFRVIVWDNTSESYPIEGLDYGLLDTSEFKLFAYQRISSALARYASLLGQGFKAELNSEQTEDALSAFVPLDYDAEWSGVYYTTAYDGNYTYQVRGTAIKFPVTLAGGEVRRQSNNNLLATFAPVTANWFTVTVSGTNEVIQLYQLGSIWVGRNSVGQVVTLKRL